MKCVLHMIGISLSLSEALLGHGQCHHGTLARKLIRYKKKLKYAAQASTDDSNFL